MFMRQSSNASRTDFYLPEIIKKVKDAKSNLFKNFSGKIYSLCKK